MALIFRISSIANGALVFLFLLTQLQDKPKALGLEDLFLKSVLHVFQNITFFILFFIFLNRHSTCNASFFFPLKIVHIIKCLYYCVSIFEIHEPEEADG